MIASLLDKLDVATVTRGRIDARNEDERTLVQSPFKLTYRFTISSRQYMLPTSTLLIAIYLDTLILRLS